MKRFLMLFLFLSSLIACQKEEILSSDIIETESNFISLDDALGMLDAQIQVLYGTTTKSEGRFIPEEVTLVSGTDILGAETKCDDLYLPDSLLYLVNFHDSTGYAILPASREIDNGVFCITEAGSISADSFKRAFKRLTESSGESNEEVASGEFNMVPELILSELMLKLKYGINVDENVDTKAAPSGTKYGPYLKTKWGQRRIYGTRVFNRYTDNHAPAGCVAIATAQIIEYRKLANSNVFWRMSCSFAGMESVYNYSTLGLDEDTTYYDQVAHFVRELGRSNQCKIRYGSSEHDSSGGYAEGAQRAFQYYGYKDVDKHLGFGSHNQKIATKVIRAARPAYLDGKASGLAGEGHAWVLDGECGDYYHVNWGWYGNADGYFNKGTFKTTDRYSVDSVIDTDDEIFYVHNFTWDYRLVTYGAGFNY